jgi:hypothetical protein
MGSRPDRGQELLDQPRRQTMSFKSMPAALEADPQRRIMRLVLLVDDQDRARESHRWHIDQEGRLNNLPLQPWSVEGSPYYWRKIRAATAIADAVEKAFTGLKFTADWSRWLIHRTDGVKIEGPAYFEERGALEMVIRVESDANYDRVYGFIMQVLERQPGYESRGFRPSVFTEGQETAIERMPKEDQGPLMPSLEKRATPPLTDLPPREPWNLAADLLRRFLQLRRGLSQ